MTQSKHFSRACAKKKKKQLIRNEPNKILHISLFFCPGKNRGLTLIIDAHSNILSPSTIQVRFYFEEIFSIVRTKCNFPGRFWGVYVNRQLQIKVSFSVWKGEVLVDLEFYTGSIIHLSLLCTTVCLLLCLQSWKPAGICSEAWPWKFGGYGGNLDGGWRCNQT